MTTHPRNSSSRAENIVGPFLDGALSDSGDESTIDVIDPSNGQICSAIPAGCEMDVNRAVGSARCAFDDGRWSDASPLLRKVTLSRFADLIAAEGAVLDALDAREMGKPISVAFCNAAAAAGLVRFYSEAVDKVVGDVYSSDKHSFVAQRRVPRGVVAAVVPWNFPTYCAVLKVAPALAAGNCVVLKPSEMATRSAMHLAHLAIKAGVPPGVFNVVPGVGEIVGRALGLHPEVDMLTFTGSTAVGKLMLQFAGQSNMKLVMAECGGKSPHIVFADGVDLDAVGERIAEGLLTNQGQVCSVGSRVLVQRSIESTLVEKIAARMSRVVIGSPLDSTTTFGPLASAEQCSRVMQYIDTADANGARLVIGGRRVLQETGGYFVEPTIFRSSTTSSRIATEEVFGPVLSVIPFNDENEAIRIANSTIYGLAAYVWTMSLSTGMRVAKGIRSSVAVSVGGATGEGSGYAASSEPAVQSGIGTEGGVAGMESYLRRQLIKFDHA